MATGLEIKIRIPGWVHRISSLRGIHTFFSYAAVVAKKLELEYKILIVLYNEICNDYIMNSLLVILSQNI